MNFCKDCDNKLYPLEEDDKLYQSCKDCGFKEIYDGLIIQKKVFKNKSVNVSNNNNFLIYDNSIPRTIQKQCPNKNCDSNKNDIISESVFLQDNVSLKLTYICTTCNIELKYS
jgi:DNA-directed RNA polymerase subunit M/transcription elongation factor TFIIS